MAFAPVAFIAPSYSEQPFYWLKAYQTGTTTPLVMATDAGAVTQLAKAQLDADGFPTTDGSTIFIPYIEGAYDLYLFPTSDDADNNNTANGVRIALNQIGGSGGTGSAGGTNLLNVESVELIDGQLTAVFVSTLTYASFYINDPDADNGRLVEGIDYTVDFGTKTVTLTQSYPAGTTLTAAYNEVGTSLTNPVYFDSVADAIGSNAIVGASIITRGYYANNDGGGANYVVVAAGTGTDDGGSYLDMTNGNQLELIIEGGVINASQFGVIGSIDATSNLQAAANFLCNSSYGTLHLTDINVSVTTSINFPDMQGKNITGTGREAVINASFAGSDVFVLNKALLSEVGGFWVKGNDLTGASGTGNGVRYVGSTEDSTDFPQGCKFTGYVSGCRGDITDIYAETHRANGVYMDSGLSCSVSNAWLVGNGNGVRYDDMEQSSVDDKSIIFDNDACGVLCFDCEEVLTIQDSDIIGNTTNQLTITIQGATVPTGDIVSLACDQVSCIENKHKDSQHAIVAYRNRSVAVQGGSMKPTAGNDSIWCQGCSIHDIDGVYFIYVFAGGAQAYGGIYVDTERFDYANNISIKNNYFDLADDIAHLIKITNSDATTRQTTIDIDNNVADSFFRTVASAGTLTSAIVLESDNFIGTLSKFSFCAGNNYIITNPVVYGTNFVDGGLLYNNITQRAYNGGSITNVQSFTSNHTNRIAMKAIATPEVATQTIASDAIDVNYGIESLLGEGAVSDNLQTINGGVNGQKVVIHPANSSQNITIVHGSGNIITRSASNVVLSNNYEAIELIYLSNVGSGVWSEI